MAKTYYVWTGVGEVVDLDGDGAPLATDFLSALACFNLVDPTSDATLWERDGPRASLLAARIHGPVFYAASPSMTTVVRKAPP